MAKIGSTSRQLCAPPIDSAQILTASISVRSAKQIGMPTALLMLCFASGPAVAQDVCAHEPFFAIDMVYDRNGRPMVQAEIEGQERYLLLDTGGAKSILDPESAEELGLQEREYGAASDWPFGRGSSAPQEGYIDVTGRRSSSFAVSEELRLGERRFGPLEFVLSPIGQEQDDRFSPIGGLGSDFMMAYDVAFDFGDDVFRLFAHNQCASPPFPEDDDAATWVAVPFRLNRSNHISFPLRLDGQMLMAVLDTGAHDTILSLPAARRVFSIDLDGPDIIQAGELEGLEVANIYRRRFASLQIETLLVVDPMIFLLPDMMASRSPAIEGFNMLQPESEENAALPDFILGMSVLDRYRLYISYGQRKFYLSPVLSG